MNSVLLIRILLSIVAVIIVFLLFKLHKAIKLEKRISRYSLKMDFQEDLSYFDKLGNKYQKFVKRFGFKKSCFALPSRQTNCFDCFKISNRKMV